MRENQDIDSFYQELEGYYKKKADDENITIRDMLAHFKDKKYNSITAKLCDDLKLKGDDKLKVKIDDILYYLTGKQQQAEEEQAEEEQTEEEQTEEEQTKQEQTKKTISTVEFSTEGLINVLACYLENGENASEDDVANSASPKDQKIKFSVQSQNLKGELSSEGITSFSWPEWQHETRSAVVFQKLKHLGYNFREITNNTDDREKTNKTAENCSGAFFLYNFLAKESYTSIDGNENNQDTPIDGNENNQERTLELPNIKRILLVHKDIASSAEDQEIFSAFVISVFHKDNKDDNKCAWIDVRYAASAEEAFQRLQEEVFDFILISPKVDNSGEKGLYSNVSYSTLYQHIKRSDKYPKVEYSYISDSETKEQDKNKESEIEEQENNKDNETKEPDKSIDRIGSKEDNDSLIHFFLIGKGEPEGKNGKSNSNKDTIELLKLKKLITYYRVLPYDIFFALLRKKNPWLLNSYDRFMLLNSYDRFNFWVYINQDNKNNNLYYHTEKPKQYKKAIFFSPALHQTKNLDSLLKQVSDEKTYSPEDNIDKLYTWNNGEKTEKTIIVKQKTSHNANNNLIAAATPLTGVSAIGHKHAIDVLCEKVKYLLDGPFDRVVLKTVYQDYMDDDEDNPTKTIHWPELQAQSHHRARCLRSREQTRTLWNTGKTALESLSPKMMGDFIKKMIDEENKQASPSPKKQQNLTLEELTHKVLESNNEKATLPKYTPNIIISLGSKFPQEKQKGKVYRTHQPVFHEKYFEKDVKAVWEALYTSVFGKKPSADKLKAEQDNTNSQSNKSISNKGTASENQSGSTTEEPFDWVEINVRHYLRECVAFHLGGNEYLSPAKVDEHFTGNYTQMLEEFVCWLEVINQVAKDWQKKVLLKLPFRGDLLHFLNEIIIFYNYKCRDENEKYGIKGITLINAFKSAISENQAKVPFSPAWYGMTNAWGDAADKKWKYQMSGELLNASRNELLHAVVEAICKTDMELHISGGVVSQDDISFLKKMVQEFDSEKTPKIQIGTWGLIDLNLSKSTLDSSCAKDAASDGNGRPMIENCSSCSQCKAKIVCSNGAIEHISGQKAKINPAKCKNCKSCISACQNVTLTTGLVKTSYEYPTRDIKSDDAGFTWGGYKVKDDKSDKEHIIRKTIEESSFKIPNVENHTICLEGCKVINECPKQALTMEDNKLTLDEQKCAHCGKCIKECCFYNNNDKRLTSKTITKKIIINIIESKAIQPRIAFWLHDLCNGCGKCSRTFYCDSFLDRRGLDGPPMMDTRNCTGCGLCVQTCPQGAIQMFEPKHYTILLGENNDLMEWRQFLTAEQIPHLVYTKEQLFDTWKYFGDEAKKYFGDEAKKRTINDVIINWRCEFDKCTEMYSNKDGYQDDRNAKKIMDFLNKIQNQSENNDLLTLWYSLALSDPGQILKESPVILVNKEKQTTQIYTYSLIDKLTKKKAKDNTPETQKPETLLRTPEAIRACESLEEIRIDVAKRLSNLREEKR